MQFLLHDSSEADCPGPTIEVVLRFDIVTMFKVYESHIFAFENMWRSYCPLLSVSEPARLPTRGLPKSRVDHTFCRGRALVKGGAPQTLTTRREREGLVVKFDNGRV